MFKKNKQIHKQKKNPQDQYKEELVAIVVKKHKLLFQVATIESTFQPLGTTGIFLPMTAGMYFYKMLSAYLKSMYRILFGVEREYFYCYSLLKLCLPFYFFQAHNKDFEK